MRKEYVKCLRVIKKLIPVTVAIVLLIFLSQVLGGNQKKRPPKSSMVPVPEKHKQRIARQLASGFGLGPFQPSLEIKEDTDFFLTPALLVQEAICDDVIITYPTE